MKTTTSILALALALAAPAAFAHPGDDATKDKMAMHEKTEMHEKMEMHDKMGMGEMTPEQHQQMVDRQWADMDANKDGSVSRAEFDAHVARMMAMRKQMHEGMDKDAAQDKAGHAMHEAAEDSSKAAHEAAEAKEDAAKAAAKHK